MWYDQSPRPARPLAADQLTLSELIATQPRLLRQPLAPGNRLLLGMRPSRRRAQGVDLDSIAPYVPGDDVRCMDWRATARTGRAQMKRFVAESHLARMLIVDLRPSLFFGTRKRPMAKTAALVAARFSWEALNLHEPVGLIVVPTAEVIQPRRGKGHILYLLQRLQAHYKELKERRERPPGEELARALETAAGHLRRGDEICAISDFGVPDRTLAAVAMSLANTYKLWAVIIEDAIFSAPVPAGRYPMRMGHGDGRLSAEVSTKDAREQPRIAEEIRRSMRLKLLQSGWKTYLAGTDFLHRDSRP